ncbi:MAG: UDP-N-acetylglucosamine 2-epimerase (hydrolyzing) [Rhodospirillales bacterium]|nr:UDP-N-acetylglucosamine 2-epimerase (hydrolyzing) [Rhodospirillales bacterium]
MRKVAIALTTRGNYGKMLSTMRAIRARPDLELRLIVGGGILRNSFGDFVPVVEADGFKVDRKVDYLEGMSGDADTMLRSAARAVDGFGAVLAELAPDVVVVIADRYEALSIAFAATCRSIPIAHLEGGEMSGSIDDRIRHAITMLAQIHLPASRSAAARLVAMGERRESVHLVGSPSFDIIGALDLADLAPLDAFQAVNGSGPAIDHRAPFVLVSQHPVVEEEAQAEAQTVETAAAVAAVGLPVVWVQPNMDAGSVGVRRALARSAALPGAPPMHVYASLPLPLYARAMKACRCMLGNSSSGIREAAFLGVPVVNVGTRQRGRERGRNVVDVGYVRSEMEAAIRRQLAHGAYAPDDLYGNGRSGERIAEVLASAPLELAKWGAT